MSRTGVMVEGVTDWELASVRCWGGRGNRILIGLYISNGCDAAFLVLVNS